MKESYLDIIKKLESETLGIEKLLIGITYTYKDSQDKIDESWKRLDTNKIKIESLYKRIVSGDKAYEEKDTEKAFTYYSLYMNDVNLVRTNLAKIPILIEEAKELDESKTCFLFWCW